MAGGRLRGNDYPYTIKPSNTIAPPIHYTASQDSTVPSVDPQLLEDMDMLMVLGEDS
ncbi:MAG: hypothetical protein IPG70_08830 [Moraxellaceae bacterium]|nr:hypothetical protein [Moraxellaceae bacterium]